MRTRFTGLTAIQIVAWLLAGDVALAQDIVGEVTSFTPDESYVYHELTAEAPSPREPITEEIPVHDRDALEATRKGEVKFLLDDSEAEITVRAGRVQAVDGGEVVVVKRGWVRYEATNANVTLADARAVANSEGTIYEFLSEPSESRVYVYEGTATVSSKDPRFPEPVRVHAGEWVRALDGAPVSEPRVFILDDTRVSFGSGSSSCIHSNCKRYDPVFPPQPPIGPHVIIPPPPNPPGQR